MLMLSRLSVEESVTKTMELTYNEEKGKLLQG